MNAAPEMWKPVVGHEGFYEVSDLGRIRSLPRSRCKGSVLATVADSDGYPTVTLSKYGRKTRQRVYVLVAAAFLGARQAGTEVRHLDGIGSNSAATNLAYGTHADNELDKVRHGTHQNAVKTHCPRNHGPYDYTYADGRRGCRSCRNESERARYARSR